MGRRFSFAIVFLFLAVQALSLLHMAEHGFVEHKHAGHICDIYLNSEQSKHADVPAAPVLAVPMAITQQAIIPASSIAETERHNSSFPRAPPIFS